MWAQLINSLDFGHPLLACHWWGNVLFLLMFYFPKIKTNLKPLKREEQVTGETFLFSSIKLLKKLVDLDLMWSPHLNMKKITAVYLCFHWLKVHYLYEGRDVSLYIKVIFLHVVIFEGITQIFSQPKITFTVCYINSYWCMPHL